MLVITFGIIAIALYLAAFALRVIQLRGQPGAAPATISAMGLVALLAHGVVSARQTFTEGAVDFGLLPVSVAIFWVINAIVVVSSFKKPLHNLFLLLFPATALMLALSLSINDRGHVVAHPSLALSVHILLSLFAYSLMTIAALQALLLAYQNRQLHQHRPTGAVLTLPPLQTMETLLFEVIAVGFALLTLALATGFVFVDNFVAQHVAHKAVFSLIAWLLYGTLLVGHYRLGWRGKVAIAWTLGGFAALMLAYWGTKFVLEVILARGS